MGLIGKRGGEAWGSDAKSVFFRCWWRIFVLDIVWGVEFGE